jgi:hypothetical protein
MRSGLALRSVALILLFGSSLACAPDDSPQAARFDRYISDRELCSFRVGSTAPGAVRMGLGEPTLSNTQGDRTLLMYSHGGDDAGSVNFWFIRDVLTHVGTLPWPPEGRTLPACLGARVISGPATSRDGGGQ